MRAERGCNVERTDGVDGVDGVDEGNSPNAMNWRGELFRSFHLISHRVTGWAEGTVIDARALVFCLAPRDICDVNVAIEIPDDVSAPLQAKWKDVPRRILEAIAVEAYRTGALTAHQAGQLLGHTSRWQTEAFLKRTQAYLHYSEADLAHDLENLRAMRGR